MVLTTGRAGNEGRTGCYGKRSIRKYRGGEGCFESKIRTSIPGMPEENDSPEVYTGVVIHNDGRRTVYRRGFSVTVYFFFFL